MTWLASIVRGIMEAILPRLFTKEKTVAKTSEPMDRRLVRSWAGRINRLFGELHDDSADDDSDPPHRVSRGRDPDRRDNAGP